MERWAKHRRRAVRKQVVVDESQGPVQTRRHRRPPLRRRAVNQIILRVEIALRACGSMDGRYDTPSVFKFFLTRSSRACLGKRSLFARN